MVTRNISLDCDCLNKMQPYVQKHKGNFSAAIREIIDRAGNYKVHMNSQMVDNNIFKWLLTETDSVLISDNVLDEVLDSTMITSMKGLEDYLKQKFNDIEWGVDIIIKSDVDSQPNNVLIEIKGSYQKIKFVARILSQYMVKYASLEIKSVNNFGDCITIEMTASAKANAEKSLNIFFGEMNDTIKTIKNNPSFWKTIVSEHVLSNYNMVTIHRNCFEDLLVNKIPVGGITIETIAKKPLSEIPLKELLTIIKEVYEASKIVNRVEIDKDNIILFHSYRNDDVVDKLKNGFVTLLANSGHFYDAKSTPNIIVLTPKSNTGGKL